MYRGVNISFYPWHRFISQERKQHKAKFKPNADITLSSRGTHWGASQLHLLGPPKRPLNNKPHSGASLNLILRILHVIYICLISAKSKCHTRQGLYNKYMYWEITWLDCAVRGGGLPWGVVILGPDLPPVCLPFKQVSLVIKRCFILMCAYVCVFAPVYRYLQRSEEDIGFPGAQVIGSCELPRMAAGNLTQVLSKRSKYSWLLSPLFSPQTGWCLTYYKPFILSLSEL